MALSSIQKEKILQEINSGKVPIESIRNFINRGEFTLEECIEHGLEDSKVEQINLLEVEEQQEQKQFEEDAEFYAKINNDEIIIQEIQRAITDGRVTDEGLLKNTIIDENLLHRIKSYSKESHPSQHNDLDLKNGYTDIFFFGQSGSGKSCVLASLFNYGEKQGYLIDDPHSINGINYKNLLVRELRNGILPDATIADVDAVTYITTELHKEDENGKMEINPLNIIEMSGEFFSEAAKDPDVWENAIDAHGYLSNSNKKLLFFIVDYHQHTEDLYTHQATQDQDFNLILSQLDMYKKCLKNTYCVYIIVNKSDLFPDGVGDKNTYATEFFMENYKGFYTNLKSKQEKNGFSLRSLHFSLGNFIFNNSYLTEMNQECPEQLIESISKQSSRRKSKGWFNKMFESSEEL